jgi:hypothetical protein
MVSRKTTSLGVNMPKHVDDPILGYFAPPVRPLEQTFLWGCEQDVADRCWRLFNIAHAYWVGEFRDCSEACRAVAEVLGEADQWPIEAWQEPIKPSKSGKAGKAGKSGKSGKAGKGFGQGGKR